MAQEKKTEAEMNDLEYLKYSLEILGDEENKTRERLAILKGELESLKNDISEIQTARLKSAAMNAHNQLVQEQGMLRNKLKSIRTDLMHVRSIHKKLKEKVRK